MKKLVLLALCFYGAVAFSQSVNVASALQDMKKGYLKNAQKEIELACNHDETKNDAKTWLYSAQIYAQIGSSDKFRTSFPDWKERFIFSIEQCIILQDITTNHIQISSINLFICR